MSRPTITVEFSPTTNPLATPSWVDISDYVRAIETRMGRNHELGRVEAGTATITLDNTDRRFDPAYTTGPYYGNLLPMRRMRVRAEWSSTTYYLFTGFVESWTPVPKSGSVVELEVPLVDAFKYFASATVTLAGDPVESSDAKIVRILNALSYTDVVLESGYSMIQSLNLTDDNVLSWIQAIVDSEFGLLVVEADGIAYFYNRHHRMVHHATSVATFGDGAGELPYENLIFSYDDTEIYNYIIVSKGNSSDTGTASDSTSQAKYFKRTLSRTSYVNDSNELVDAAQWLLLTYKEPAIRAERLILNGDMDDALWPYVLGLGINDRVTAKQRPWGGGNVISQEVFIEHIDHQIDMRPESDGLWHTTWQLSPAGTEIYGILDDTTYGLLDSTARLAY